MFLIFTWQVGPFNLGRSFFLSFCEKYYKHVSISGYWSKSLVFFLFQQIGIAYVIPFVFVNYHHLPLRFNVTLLEQISIQLSLSYPYLLSRSPVFFALPFHLPDVPGITVFCGMAEIDSY
jgi:hypothetical protein